MSCGVLQSYKTKNSTRDKKDKAPDDKYEMRCAAAGPRYANYNNNATKRRAEKKRENEQGREKRSIMRDNRAESVQQRAKKKRKQ